jgi:hypothetical protein
MIEAWAASVNVTMHAQASRPDAFHRVTGVGQSVASGGTSMPPSTSRQVPVT